MSTAMEAATHVFEITTTERATLRLVRAGLDYHATRLASPSPLNSQDLRHLQRDLRDFTRVLDELEGAFAAEIKERDELALEFATTFVADPCPTRPSDGELAGARL